MGRLPDRQNASLFSDSIRGAIAVPEREFGRNIRTYLVGPSFVQVPFGVRSPTLRSGARRDFAVRFDATSPLHLTKI